MAATVIQFPGPKQKTLLDIAHPSSSSIGSNIGRAPTPIRPLSEREVDHRRQMLMHLQCLGDSAHSR